MTDPAPQPTTTGQQKAVVDANLQKVIEHFARLKADSCTQRTNNDAVPWFRPEIGSGWTGALQTEADLTAIHKAFQTDEAEAKLIETYKPGDSGNVGDGVVLPLQIDYMMQAERAYRARTTQSFPRSVAHVASRERGHGQPNGALLGQALKYFTTLLKQGAS